METTWEVLKEQNLYRIEGVKNKKDNHSVLQKRGRSIDPKDVSDDVPPVGLGSEGNQFVFIAEDKWHYNLKTTNCSASGTYYIKRQSGDESEYTIDSLWEASFTVP